MLTFLCSGVVLLVVVVFDVFVCLKRTGRIKDVSLFYRLVEDWYDDNYRNLGLY